MSEERGITVPEAQQKMVEFFDMADYVLKKFQGNCEPSPTYGAVRSRKQHEAAIDRRLSLNASGGRSPLSQAKTAMEDREALGSCSRSASFATQAAEAIEPDTFRKSPAHAE